MISKAKLIGWDIALLVSLIILIALFSNDVKARYYLIAGIAAGRILANCIMNHIAAYKLTGKIY